MARYGTEYGRWNHQGRYDRDRGHQGGGYGGQAGSWREWQNLPGEAAWFGEGHGGYPAPGYDFDYGGGFGSGYSGYGNEYNPGYGGYGSSGWGRHQGNGEYGRYSGYGMGQGSYDTGMEESGERGGRHSGGGHNMRAADLMTEEPEAVSPETTLAEVAQKMRDLDVGIIPVVESDQTRRLRGVITDRDITIRATAEGKDARSTKVSEVMTSSVGTVNKNDRIRDVLQVMRRERVKRVPVTDREGRLVGIIAEADLLTDIDGHEQEHMVENTLEHVYEPSRIHRGPRNSST